ncbi:hypothetical protein LC605_15960 [Nostoc sp. CHAB 5836]|uniref:hypothetical protein n=1 Tax=Nostoc sp. CHAB 5836 TaxID=2780404 RepID=UPI001E441E59|nr:hypothetical protein [Nostoc sp. CHAB 5836]MCC5616540.1 hypothetical protein [Nostoc sp. CHAB 5836]
MCVSSTPNEISQGEQTAHAPLGGASPQIVVRAAFAPEGVEEKQEDLPVATDCTTLKLVDAAQSQPTSLLTENQDSGDEQKDLHEGLSSAVPSVPHKQNLTNTDISNILDAANQGVCPDKETIAALLETPYARSLLGAITLNPQWGINLSDYSTVPQDFKLRSQRLNRLKSYAANCECPPVEFLQECQNDPVLKIQLSSLAAREHWDIREIFST